jgi:hypothetical protein
MTEIPVTGISLNAESVTLHPGDSFVLYDPSDCVIPQNATDKSVAAPVCSPEGIVSVAEDGTVTAQKAGTTTITVTASNGVSASCTVTVELAAPTVKSAAIGTGSSANGVTVTWTAVPGASKYRISRKAGNGSYVKLKETVAVSYKDTTAVSGTTYTYKVECVSSDGKTIQSAAATKSLVVLVRPTVKTANAAKGVTISWNKNSNAAGYYIYRNGSKIATITKGTTVSYTDTKAANGTSYTYTVQTYSRTAKSVSSTGSRILRVTAPAISSLTNSASKKMTVKWVKNAKASGYQIQYATSSSFSGAKTVTVTKGTTVSQVIASLVKNKTYYVRMRAYIKQGTATTYSAYSTAKTVKITK